MNKRNISQEFDSCNKDRAASNSEDELDVLLNEKLIREYLTGESELSSGDEFEKEMEVELSSTIRTMEGTWGATTSEAGGGTGQALPNPRMYDMGYFDSSSDDEDNPSSSTGQRQRQRVIPTNDELLYDPDEDDIDQAWVDARRRVYSNRKRPAAARRSQGQRVQGLPNSDAILNCPACVTTLCLDCQRHEKYRTQYRAMFVINCTVKRDDVLRYKPNKEKRKQRNQNETKGQITEMTLDDVTNPMPAGMDADEVYNPVQCSECSTEVAVFDKEEVYHFFNILASHC